MNHKNLWRREILSNKRFKFGRNWLNFSKLISENEISEAEESFKNFVGINSLKGKKFCDIGCGSGLMSLIARNLGAEVFSFDFDRDSVRCTRNLKDKYYANDPKWIISEGSVLDLDFIKHIGKWDIVYSWGVLHHTGDMRQALENVLVPLSNNQGKLFISIYNDEGYISKIWRKIKKFYVKGAINALFIKLIFLPPFLFFYLLLGTIKNLNPLHYFKFNNKNIRGMSIYFDFIDWIGGYPFEVAKPEEIINLYKSKGLKLQNLKTTNRLGCNEYIFEI